MKVWQSLEAITKLRVNSNAEIPHFMKRYAESGRFDEPKKNALLVEILCRLAALEEKEESVFPSYSVPIEVTPQDNHSQSENSVVQETEPVPPSKSWQEVLQESLNQD